MTSTYGDEETRKFALHYLPKVARTGSQLRMFIDYIGPMRGWGRGLRRAVGEWYTEKNIKNAVYQAVKYRQRYNWTHRDLLRKSHPKAASSDFNDFFAWITQGGVATGHTRTSPLSTPTSRPRRPTPSSWRHSSEHTT